MTRLFVLRLLVVATVLAGGNYLLWRWLFSLNFDAWWIAIPLVLAETYSLLDSLLFGLGAWRLKERDAAPRLTREVTVDVLVTTYNEPLDLVMQTARAAKQIRYPHQTWILDDGDREEMRDMADLLGVGYITRGREWAGHPHHAKAGNLNNALMITEGEFLLVLDADQVPHPDILHQTLGHFEDPDVALVQTPQHFSNVPAGDPLGSQAPLFYGPIQQGKDGWNAAFFCGSNAVLRREALMRLGLEEYGTQVERAVKSALQRADRILVHAMRSEEAGNPVMRAALTEITHAIDATKAAVAAGEPLASATYRLQQSIEAIRRDMVAIDMHLLAIDLQAIRDLEADAGLAELPAFDEAALQQLSPRSVSPLRTMGAVQELVRAIDVDRSGEAQALMPLATDSVTEDMATAMRLHARGWKSVYHHEILATGVAPENLGTMLKQRLRWAQGTMQVFLQENPLLQRGLKLPQRLMYFSTMWSYLSGFPAVVYFVAPIVFLCFGVLPVSSSALEFFLRFLPFLLINQLLFAVAGRGLATWRGQQYSLALFPVWIRAFTSALTSTLRRRELGFAVTDKTGRKSTGEWRMLLPQIVVAAFLVSAAVAGVTRLMLGVGEPIGTAVNLAWVIFDLVILSVLVGAVRYSRKSSEGGVHSWTFRSRM